MKCSNCDGRGAVQIAPNVKGLKRCPVCGGSGEVSQIEQTKEEWFCGLSTEEKAKWITENITVYADDWVKSDEELLNPATWVEWLKEKHVEVPE